MRADQIMTTEVMTVHADTTVEEVARLLTTRRVGSVPVVDDDQRVVGVVNDEELFTSEKGHAVFGSAGAAIVREVGAARSSGGDLRERAAEYGQRCDVF